MSRVINFFDRVSKVASIDLARTTTRRKAVGRIVGGTIAAVIGVSALSHKEALAAPCDKCQQWYVGSSNGCSPPNGRYCSGCRAQASCPTGYKLSYAWGYGRTGCWCSSFRGSGSYTICCDCTRSANSNRTRYSSDCGCSSAISQSGYCVNANSVGPEM